MVRGGVKESPDLTGPGSVSQRKQLVNMKQFLPRVAIDTFLLFNKNAKVKVWGPD